MKSLTLRNQKFGRLQVRRIVDIDTRGRLWLCRCLCGGSIQVHTARLRDGSVKSCGCLRHEAQIRNGRKVGKSRFKHGHATRQTRTYRSWSAMVQRVTNVANPSFRYYGARGVSICPGLRQFEDFLNVMGERPENKTLSRRSDLGIYACGSCLDCRKASRRKNCAWSSPRQQILARRKKAALLKAEQKAA
jgi:hypothetical protein